MFTNVVASKHLKHSKQVIARGPHMAKLQAASVPIAQGSCAPRAAAPWDRRTDTQTDGSPYRLMPPAAGA